MVKRLTILFMTVVCFLTIEASDILIESESFDQLGGWVTDQQFMDQMGSPYLMAHGMGSPVPDASTGFNVSESATYHVYARTYNWTAPWTLKSGPGKFTIKINGKLLQHTIGDTGNKWQWQKAGTVKLNRGTNLLTLHDLTGFNGRCDAIFLTTDSKIDPTTWDMKTTDLTRKCLNPVISHTQDGFDLVVVGGGIAGMCAAVSAARLGCKVALVNDRPVLGGNNSSEIRVHLSGISELEPNPALGRMLREFGQSKTGNAKPASYYEDDKKEKFIASEKNITLYANYRAVNVQCDNNQIQSVTIRQIGTTTEQVLRGRVFSDCTGDGTIGYLAGADWAMGREGRNQYYESLAPEQADSMVMGASVQWYALADRKNSVFPSFNYGMNFNSENCERVIKGEWTWETGMNRNQITDAERIRDYGLMSIFSNWSYLKNEDSHKADYNKYRLSWVAYVAGKRESRRLLGDYVLSQDDIDKNVAHEDASFTTSWSIDLHFPDTINAKRFPGNEFKSQTIHRWIHPYAVPYRCLYSRNIDNLFMAGRDISCTHVALGTVRVMRTTAMMGEVVGMAASLCRKYSTTPRGVYRKHLDELKILMKQGVGHTDLPNNQRFNRPNILLDIPRAFMDNK